MSASLVETNEVIMWELYQPDNGFYRVKNKEEIEWEIEAEGWRKMYGG